MVDEQEPINFTTERMLAKYAAGVQVANIADDFEVSYANVYSTMKEHPDAYAAAKLELLKHRNAKHRRLSALTIDVQLDYVHHLSNKDISDLTDKEVATLQKIGEASDRRADLNEGKATEITENKGVTMEIIFEGDKPESLR